MMTMCGAHREERLTMATEAANRKDIRRLAYDDDGVVLIDGEDGDRYVLYVTEVLERCKYAERRECLARQLNKLLKSVLSGWLADHAAVVRDAFLTFRDGGLLFIVVRNRVRHDFETTRSLADLDLAIARDDELDLIRFDSVALPDCPMDAVLSFCEEDWILRYDRHADHG